MTGLRALLPALVLLALCADASAKEIKFSSPGRDIYHSNESFASALDQGGRNHVIELSMGSGAEGNLGVAVGWLLNKPGGLELYAAFGGRIGPVFHYSASFRYFLPIGGLHAYLGGGYILQSHSRLHLRSHSGFADLGYKWVIRRTYHVTLTVGLQRIFARSLHDDSPLRAPDVDQDSLAHQLDSVEAYRPLACLRFSRAF